MSLDGIERLRPTNIQIVDLRDMPTKEAERLMADIEADREMKRIDDELARLDPDFAMQVKSSYSWENAIIYSKYTER